MHCYEAVYNYFAFVCAIVVRLSMVHIQTWNMQSDVDMAVQWIMESSVSSQSVLVVCIHTGLV